MKEEENYEQYEQLEVGEEEPLYQKKKRITSI